MRTTPLGSRDARTGRVYGFQSEAQRENFLAARARFSDGADRLMPRCMAKTRMGLHCRAARMRGQKNCFCHSGGAVRHKRHVAVHLSGDAARIQSAQFRSERNRLRVVWRRDPREPGRTITLIANDEESCRAWAAREGFQLELLDNDFPAFSDACRWTWARKSRGLISDDDLATKVARLHKQITEVSHAFDLS
jgi:hypothetical protein